jgi:thiol:disulfide interchange protein DsbD
MTLRKISRLLLLGSILISPLSWGGLFEDDQQRTTAIPASEAIQFESLPSDAGLQVLFTLKDHIYLYRDKLTLTLKDGTPYKHATFTEDPKIIQDPSFGEVAVFFNSATLVIDQTQLPTNTQQLTMKYQGCDEAIGLCYPPTKVTLAVKSTAPESNATIKADSNSIADLDNAGSIQRFLQNAGALVVIATFLLLGIGLTFTPCVLPMVPILSSVIAGHDNLTPRKGFMLSTAYVLGMAITFSLAGVLVGTLGARFNIQIYMQQPWVLSIFAGMFVILALSMFGFYEIRLPRFIQDPLDKLNQNQKGGGLISVFLMGALSAIVVSPCVTAPLAGALVYISTTGDAALGGFALFALGLGMGLPLIAIGTTGASVMPKAGVWMEKVKSFFGVLLLAVALWILGRVLPEDIYIGAWIILLGTYAVILGAFEAAASGKQRLIKGLALITFAFAIMLMFNAVIGISEPQTTTSHAKPTNNQAKTHKSTSIFKSITTEEQLKLLLSTGKNQEKIVMVDLYADWCIECKIMAKTLFGDEQVKSKLAPFESIKLDITEFNDFHKSYLEENGIFGPPALLFYGKDGAIIKDAQILGEISKEDFLQHLDQFDHQ